MLPDMAPDLWNLQHRMRRARRYLSYLKIDEITRVIADRLAGLCDPQMPPLERFEDGADIFIDATLQRVPDYPNLPDQIREASGLLLQRLSQQPSLENVEIVGEAIFLAARIEAESAIPAISALVTHKDATRLLSNGEQLRTRGLRALFGLLIKFPDSEGKMRSLFEQFSFTTANVDVCIPALVALYGDDLDALVQEASARDIEVPLQQVRLQLRAAGLL